MLSFDVERIILLEFMRTLVDANMHEIDSSVLVLLADEVTVGLNDERRTVDNVGLGWTKFFRSNWAFVMFLIVNGAMIGRFVNDWGFPFDGGFIWENVVRETTFVINIEACNNVQTYTQMKKISMTRYMCICL